jgi:hypothetical protein
MFPERPESVFFFGGRPVAVPAQEEFRMRVRQHGSKGHYYKRGDGFDRIIARTDRDALDLYLRTFSFGCQKWDILVGNCRTGEVASFVVGPPPTAKPTIEQV